jgi:hypothetical protein
MRFFFNQSTNQIQIIEVYSKSHDVDHNASKFLEAIDNMFKIYIFSNTDFKVFELKNKAEYDRLNEIRVGFINFLCKHLIIHPSEFIRCANATNDNADQSLISIKTKLLFRLENIFKPNHELVFSILKDNAHNIFASINNNSIIPDSDPATSAPSTPK